MLKDNEIQQLNAIDTLLRSISPDKLLAMAEQEQIVEKLAGAYNGNTSFIKAMHNELTFTYNEIIHLRTELQGLKDDMRTMVKAMRTMQNGVAQSYGDLAPLCSKYGQY